MAFPMMFTNPNFSTFCCVTHLEWMILCCFMLWQNYKNINFIQVCGSDILNHGIRLAKTVLIRYEIAISFVMQWHFNSSSTVRCGQLPGQLHFRVSSCSVIIQNSFKFLGLIQVINGNSESPLLFGTLKIKLNNLCDTLHAVTSHLDRCFFHKEAGHAEKKLTCKLFSFYLTPWVFASLWWRIRINYLCIKVAFVYNPLFQRGPYMPSFRCRNWVTNKGSWTTQHSSGSEQLFCTHNSIT